MEHVDLKIYDDDWNLAERHKKVTVEEAMRLLNERRLGGANDSC